MLTTWYDTALRVGKRKAPRSGRRPALLSRRSREPGNMWSMLHVLFAGFVSALTGALFVEYGLNSPVEVFTGGATGATAHPVLRRPLAFIAQPLLFMAVAIGGAATLAIQWLMFPGRGGGTTQSSGPRGSHRAPPAWSPERESTYPFRYWTQDLLAWSVVNDDMSPGQQASSIILSLSGAARELVRNLTLQEMTEGGVDADGNRVDPVSYILNLLASHFAPLGEEARLAALCELMRFNRRPGEPIDALLSRFLTTRHRAASGGAGMTMSWEVCSLTLLQACGVSQQQMVNILQPFQGRIPVTEAEFNAMQLSLRRMGHVLENHPNNIASRLRGSAARNFFTGYGENSWNQWEEDTNQEQPGSSDPWHTGTDPWQNSSGEMHPTPDGGHTQWSPGDISQTGATSTYHAHPNRAQPSGDADSGTDTDTVSSIGWGNAEDPAFADWAPGEVDEHLFWQYQRAKSDWRRHMRKPTRRVRRFMKRKGKGKGSKGKGKSKGKDRFAFLSEMTDDDITSLFFGKGKGKGKGKRSTGKGKGRKKNPIGRDGEIMRCSICGSDTHFRAECPQGRGESSGYVHTTPEMPPPLTGMTDAPDTHAFMLVPATAYTSDDNDVPMPDSTTSPQRYEWPAISTDQAPAIRQHFRSRGPASDISSSVFEPQLTASNLEALSALHTAVPSHVHEDVHTSSPWGSRPAPQAPVVTPRPLPESMSPQPSPFRQQAQFTAADPAIESPAVSWSQRVAQVTNLWEQSVPQATARLHDDATHRPAAITPELDSFRQLHAVRMQNLQNRALSSGTQVSRALVQHTTGVPVDGSTTPTMPGTTGEQFEAMPNEFRTYVTGMAQLQQRNSENAARIRDRRRRDAVRRLAAAAESGYRPAGDDTPQSPHGSPRSGIAAPICAICQQPIEYGDEVSTLQCAHHYHSQCHDEWNAYHIAHDREATCPQCRGSLTETRRQIREATVVEEHNIGTPNTQVSFASAVESTTCLPWWPAQDESTLARVYNHSATQLPGKLSVIVDSGAWTNLMGINVARALAQRAIERGFKPSQNKMTRPLKVQGVGNGEQQCQWQCVTPVAVPHQDGSAGGGTFTAPVVQGGPGAQLPALLGLRSMEQQRAILDTGGRTLIIPGPGDVEIRLPPGSVRIPLEKAPSGHLVMVVDDYDNLPHNSGGLEQRKTHFLAGTNPDQDETSTVNPTTEDAADAANPASPSTAGPVVHSSL